VTRAAKYPDLENVHAAAYLANAISELHVCPNCDGDGSTPWSLSHERGGWCSCCHGSGVVNDKRRDEFGANYRSQVLYHSGRLP